MGRAVLIHLRVSMSIVMTRNIANGAALLPTVPAALTARPVNTATETAEINVSGAARLLLAPAVLIALQEGMRSSVFGRTAFVKYAVLFGV